jgi:rod shape-determining protein MreC
MFKRAYDILYDFRSYAVAAACIAVSLLLLATNDSRQIKSIRSLAVGLVGTLQDAASFLPEYFGLKRENDLLRAMNLRLSDEVSRLREARLENIRLRQMLELKHRPSPRFIAANVVGKNLQLLRNTITIDAGERDGVAPQMPVVTEAGLAGKVVSTAPGYSVAQLLLNRDVRVSAKIQRNRVDGIVRWEGGRTLGLYNVAKTLDVQPGDVVITSEYSGIFPAGIRIGVVESSRNVPGSLFQSIAVVPSVDFQRLERVAVIATPEDSSRAVLERTLPAR